MKFTRRLLVLSCVPAVVAMVALLSAASRPNVSVESMNNVGPRPVEEQTRASIVRDYLLAWKAANEAMSQNRSEFLDSAFTGQAREKLAETVRQQQRLDLQTTYEDTSHHIKVLFYSPEGLSIQLADDVEYDVQLRSHGKELVSQHVHTRYLAVLTPTESKWKVRIFQGGS
jgi:hypothetical protein